MNSLQHLRSGFGALGVPQKQSGLGLLLAVAKQELEKSSMMLKQVQEVRPVAVFHTGIKFKSMLEGEMLCRYALCRPSSTGTKR